MEKEKITHPNVKVIKYKKAPKKTEEDAKPKVTIEAASDETIETTEAPTKESEPTTSDTAIDEAQGEETPAS